jgi:hypothetical protein
VIVFKAHLDRGPLLSPKLTKSISGDNSRQLFGPHHDAMPSRGEAGLDHETCQGFLRFSRVVEPSLPWRGAKCQTMAVTNMWCASLCHR